MTLSPVFRSQRDVELLAQAGVWARLAPDIEEVAEAVDRIHADLEGIIGPESRTPPRPTPRSDRIMTEEGLGFLQEFFFLILFQSVFRAAGVSDERRGFYALLDYCIKGTITAADNIFDGQAKSLLPLAEGRGSRFTSILQLICFERLIGGILSRQVAQGQLDDAGAAAIQRGLLDRMASIGELEGSEEQGVDGIWEPDTMVDAVHRVRGGALFRLAFVAPSLLEEGDTLERLRRAEGAMADMGTAFQIVDDLTDFEFDLGRRSHNLLTAQIHHSGSATEREALAAAMAGGHLDPEAVQETFAASARLVLERAYAVARSACEGLQGAGHWIDPEITEGLVQAIVGRSGRERMSAIAGDAL